MTEENFIESTACKNCKFLIASEDKNYYKCKKLDESVFDIETSSCRAKKFEKRTTKLPQIKKNDGYESIREECIEKIENENTGKITYKISIQPLAEYLINKYNFKTIYGSKSEDIFVFSEGIYKRNGREMVHIETENILQHHCTTHWVKEVEKKINRKTSIPRENFSNIPEELVCLENGILNVKTNKFEKHNPKYLFLKKLPLKYNKEAKCEAIQNFLKEILYPEHVKVVQEWFGFQLYRRYFIKKAIIFFGERDTGKSVILNILINFIGRGNFAGLDLQTISKRDKFALMSLYQMHSNIRDDLSSQDLGSGGFKESTGGSYITGEEKFGDRFSFLTFAKHTFACNQIPSLKNIDENDEAYYMRWMPIKCDNPIPTKEQDKFLIDKLTTEQELSGLLNWAVKGLERLLKKGVFSYGKSAQEIKEIMQGEGDSLARFTSDILTQEVGNKISKEILYQIYLKYVEKLKLKLPILSKEQIGRRLFKFAPYVTSKHQGKTRFWENINLKKFEETTGILKDTYDTLYKNLRVYENRDNTTFDNIYINKKEVSYLTQNKCKSCGVKSKHINQSTNLCFGCEEEKGKK